ncbi:hypothetical protein [Cyclobacterium sp.]|uniref:hypothetical protein n=1 Tax=Cyclobacterium sp. TaxID=1966343 RepID=UPI0019921E5B|nr:hypothetical protein [Cyclobacterium sp.]MBD3630848.1 hypothetical protein [Cyclobacterium sp.]
MDTNQLMEIQNYFSNKQRDCLIQKAAYEKWLNVITPFRWFAIIIGVVLPAFLGVTIFVDSGWVNPDNWKIICSTILLLSSIVSGLHTGLQFDSHQQECVRLSKQYESLAHKFELARIAHNDEIYSQKKNLSEKYTDLIENTLTTPANWCLRRAKKEAAL